MSWQHSRSLAERLRAYRESSPDGPLRPLLGAAPGASLPPDRRGPSSDETRAVDSAANEIALDDPRLAEIVELACIDLWWHFGHGHDRQVEPYLREFPELAAAPALVLDLVDTELCCRAERGERPRLSEYVARFPKLAAELERVFAVHDWEWTERREQSRTRARPTELPHPPGLRLTQRLHADASGELYRAHDLERRRWVAVQWVATDCDESRKRAERALAAVRGLRHPTIATIIGSGVVAGRLYYVADQVEGMLMSSRLRQPLALHNVARYLQPVAAAIEVAGMASPSLPGPASSAGVLVTHRDLPVVLELGFAEACVDSGEGARRRVATVGRLLREALDAIRDPQAGASSPSPLAQSLGGLCDACLSGEYRSAGDVADDLGRIRNGQSPRVTRRGRRDA